MTSILAIKTTVNTEFEGFLDSVIKSSHSIVQNRFYLHSEQITEKSESIILLHITNDQFAKYMKQELEQIKETSVKLIHFD